MTISLAAIRFATPALGWACALLLGLLMAGMLLCAALFISNRREVQTAHEPSSERTTAQADNPSSADSPALPDAPKEASEPRTPAGSAD